MLHDAPKPTPAPISPNLAVAQLITLCGLSISPLYTTLQQNPEFFVANDIWPSTIIGLILILSASIPLGLSGIYVIAGIIHRRLQQYIHTLSLFLLFSIAFMPLTSRLLGSPWLLGMALAAAIGFGLTRLVHTNRFVSVALGLAFPVVLWFPASFLMSPGVSEVLQPPKQTASATAIEFPRTPPIVMLVLDELPTMSLLDAQGEIDARRFPNFASLANRATWYPYATTVHDYTLKALPALLTGNYPETGSVLPLRHNYPESLFSVMDGAYTFHTLEQATSLGPETNQEKHWHQNRAVLSVLADDLTVLYLHALLPKTLAHRWVPIEENVWSGLRKRLQPDQPTTLLHGEPERLRGWRMERMENRHRVERMQEANAFIATIGDYPRATMHFLHVLLPHSAWDYLPSGKKYNSASWPKSPARGERWPEHVGRSFQHAHLLQTGAVDGLLGQLIDQLESHDLFDEALIVVAADHGIHFENDADRRILSSENAASIAFVPLLIKLPHQRNSKPDLTNAQLVDVAPTILDTLMDVSVPKRDGHSLIQSNDIAAEIKHLSNRHDQRFEYSKAEYESMFQIALKKQSNTLSLGSGFTNLFNAAGLEVEIGGPVEAIRLHALNASIQTEDSNTTIEFDPTSSYVRALITGTVSLQEEPPDTALAIIATAHGIVVGTAHLFEVKGEFRFAVVIDDTLLVPGHNKIDLVVVPATP